MKKRLDELSEDELRALFKRFGRAIEPLLPAGDLCKGKCGYIFLVVDRAPDGSHCQYASNIPRDDTPELMHELADFIDQEIEAEEAEQPDEAKDWSQVCSGHTLGTGPKCCKRAGEYNGYASGPTIFTCPKSCSCHD